MTFLCDSSPEDSFFSDFWQRQLTLQLLLRWPKFTSWAFNCCLICSCNFPKKDSVEGNFASNNEVIHAVNGCTSTSCHANTTCDDNEPAFDVCSPEGWNDNVILPLLSARRFGYLSIVRVKTKITPRTGMGQISVGTISTYVSVKYSRDGKHVSSYNLHVCVSRKRRAFFTSHPRIFERFHFPRTSTRTYFQKAKFQRKIPSDSRITRNKQWASEFRSLTAATRGRERARHTEHTVM